MVIETCGLRSPGVLRMNPSRAFTPSFTPSRTPPLTPPLHRHLLFLLGNTRDVPEFVKFSPREAILDSCLLRRVSGIVISTKPASMSL
jgi:hypothetical protein